jgi:neurotransmitter-gated ion-channel
VGARWLRFVATTAVCVGILLGSALTSRATPPARDPLLAPPTLHEKMDVSVGLHILNIASIDEVDQTFTIDAYVFERWKDPRLAFTPDSADDQIRRYNYGDFWIPRVEMINAATPRDRYDTAILVSPDGTVNYSERCKAVLSTKFQLRRFPFDTQTLSIIIHPFVSAASLIKFSLNDHKTWLSSELETYSSLAQWRLEAVSPRISSWKFFDGSEVSEMRFEILVDRRSNFYVWKVILPLTLMVIISWAAFWIEASDLDNQLQVAVTTILTVIAFAFAISATMPRVPYLTYIDAFFLQCYVFVFLAIVELMTVHITHRSNARRDLGLKIRKYSRFGVPGAFIVCNIILAVHFLG